MWRWILYDTDFGFGIPWMGLAYDFNTLEFATEPNGPGWPNPPWSTFLLRKMLESPIYRNRFINIFCDRLNTIFKPSYLVDRLDSLSSYIQDIIPIHQERWPYSAQDWDYHIQIVENFAQNRHLYMRLHLTGGGKIKINTITPENYPWSGYYYPNIPIEVSAEPETGYIFSGWAQFPDSSESMKIQITDGFTLTAMFEPYISGDTADLVINEINYNSSDDFNPEDWIEIYNNGVDSVNISGWFFTDENEDHRYTFPNYTIIHAGEYLVLAQDTSAFFNLFSPTSDVFGSFEFGLSGGGELISLYDVSGRLVDQLEYDDSTPWPIEPDGNGPTLELISPDIPNDIAESWSFSSGYGTPGQLNSVSGSLDNKIENTVPNIYSLFPVYPNPFNSNVKIRFTIPSEEVVKILILNILGEKVRVLTDSNYGPGLNTLIWDGKNDYGQELSTGLYFCSLKTKKFQNSIKLLLVK